MSEKVTFVPLTDLNRGKASKIIDKLNRLKQSVFIVKNNKPEAVMISVEEYNEYREYLLHREVARRVAAYTADPDNAISQYDIDRRYGISETDLEGWEDIEIE